jgi:hypothetical protein
MIKQMLAVVPEVLGRPELVVGHVSVVMTLYKRTIQTTEEGSTEKKQEQRKRLSDVINSM